jgi:glutaredoxin
MLRNLPLRSRLGLAAIVLGFGVAVQAIGAWSQARLGAQAAAAARPGDIQMLASVTCIYCAEARAWFDRHHVPFTECLIERDAACAQVYGALQAPGTPVLLVRGQRLMGFNAQAVTDALATRSQ